MPFPGTYLPSTPKHPPLGSYIKDTSKREPSEILHLPTVRLIDLKFIIRVTHKKYEDFPSPFVHIRIDFHIQTAYLPFPEHIELKHHYANVPFPYPKEYRDIQKQSYDKNILNQLNKIEYILSIPLEELPPYMNDPDGIDSLVSWRYQIPQIPPDWDLRNPETLFNLNSQYAQNMSFIGESFPEIKYDDYPSTWGRTPQFGLNPQYILPDIPITL
jgi:hypothetical protein